MADNSKFPKENPFEVPEGYFDAIEDRIEERIRGAEKGNHSNQKFVLIIKPILGLAASFAIAFLLIYYPINKILPWYTAKHAGEKTEETNLNEELIAGYGYLDERTFFLALTTQESPTDFESDEIISFLSSELNDYEVYSEIMN
ncbi:MAG: hypothetical protein AB2L24_33650 [Mangrovibacterium sp.]